MIQIFRKNKFLRARSKEKKITFKRIVLRRFLNFISNLTQIFYQNFGCLFRLLKNFGIYRIQQSISFDIIKGQIWY